MDPVYIYRDQHQAEVSALCFAYGNKVFISGDQDGVVIIWDIQSKRPIHRIDDAHNSKGILQLCNLLDNIENAGELKFYSHGRNNEIKFWMANFEGDFENFKIKLDFVLPVNSINFCKSSLLNNPTSQHNYLATTHILDGSFLDVYDVTSMTVVVKRIGDKKLKTGMAMCQKLFQDCDYNNSCFRLIVGYENGSVYVWDIDQDTFSCAGGKCFYDVPLLCLDFCLDQQTVVIGAADSKLIQFSISYLYHIGQHDENRIKERHLDGARGIADSKYRDDSKIIATGCWDGKVRLFARKNLTLLAVLKAHKETVNVVAFASTNCSGRHYILSGSKDCKISMWDIY